MFSCAPHLEHFSRVELGPIALIHVDTANNKSYTYGLLDIFVSLGLGHMNCECETDCCKFLHSLYGFGTSIYYSDVSIQSGAGTNGRVYERNITPNSCFH